MSDTLAKITKVLLFVLMAITIFFIARFYTVMSDLDAIDTLKGELTEIEQVIDGTSTVSGTDSTMDTKVGAVKNLGYFFQWMYVLLITASLGAVLFLVYHFIIKLIDSPKAALLGLIPVVVFAGLVFIAYSYASGDLLDLGPAYDGPDNVPNVLKWTGTGLFTTYLLIGLSIVSIIFVEVTNIFK